MKMMRFAVLAALLVPAGALAQSAPAPWARFIDPTENAFAVDVPPGWSAKGGVHRVSPLVAQIGVATVSPDGTTQLFIGDPSVPGFVVPKPNQAEGSPTQQGSSQLPPGVALGYRPGAEFAKYYGPSSLAAAGCLGATLTGAQALPDLARAQYGRSVEMSRGIVVTGGFTPPQHDAGIATFTCQSGGRPLAAGVIADTSQPVAVGNWSVPIIAGYLTVPGQEGWAQASLNHMLASRQFNPQWDQAMRQQLQEALNRQKQQADQVSAAMQQQAQQFSAMMLAKSQSDQAAMTANHNAFMNQMNQQSAQRNADFKAYEAQKDLNSWNFTAHIRNGELYRDTNTGTIFEVDH